MTTLTLPIEAVLGLLWGKELLMEELAPRI